jgi:hypothetical protein
MGAFLLQLMVGQTAQFLIDQGKQLVERGLITLT